MGPGSTVRVWGSFHHAGVGCVPPYKRWRGVGHGLSRAGRGPLFPTLALVGNMMEHVECDTRWERES